MRGPRLFKDLLELLPAFLGMACAALGLFVIIGWFARIEALIQVYPTLAPMQFNTALGLLFCGIGVSVAHRGGMQIPALLGGVSAAIGGLTLLEYIFGWYLGIDELFINDYINATTSYPGRMAPNSAVCFVLSGSSLLIWCKSARGRRRGGIVSKLGMAIAALGLLAFFGYLSHVESGYGWGQWTLMAAHTSVGFVVLGVAISLFDILEHQAPTVGIGHLQRSMLGYITYGVALMVAMGAGLGILPLYEKLRDAQHMQLRQVAQTMTSSLDQFVQRQCSIAQQITSRTKARELLEAYQQQSLSGTDFQSAIEPILNDAIRFSKNQVLGVTRLTADGRNAVEVGVVAPPSAWPADALAWDEIRVAGPLRYGDGYRVVISAPIIDSLDERVGTDIVNMDFGGAAQILGDRAGLGRSGESLLYARTYTNTQWITVSDTGSLVEVEDPSRYEEWDLKSARTTEGVIQEAVDEIQHAWQWVRVGDRPWAVAVTMDETELYAPVNRQLWLTLCAVLATAVLGSVGIFFLIRPLSGGILIQSDTLEKRIDDATSSLQEELTRRREAETQLRSRNLQMEDDMKLAREIQQAFLFHGALDRSGLEDGSNGAFRIARLYQPSGAVGGDFFSFTRLDEHRESVFICDVMGHGIRAALVTAILRGLLEELRPYADQPGEYLTHINQGLRSVFSHPDHLIFATAWYIVADGSQGELRFSGAGHPNPLHLHAKSRKVEALQDARSVCGPAMGIFDDASYSTGTSTMAVGDKLILYTDGVFEVAAPDRTFYGEKRLASVISAHQDYSLDGIFQNILSDIRKFSGQADFEDDVCLIGLQCSHLGAKVPAARKPG
jgi:serine phosphatase RsbU (regulator of sigma subunit)